MSKNMLTVSERTAVIITPKEKTVELPSLKWLYGKVEYQFQDIFPSFEVFERHVRNLVDLVSTRELEIFLDRFFDYIDKNELSEDECSDVEDVDFSFYAQAIIKNINEFLKGDF